MRVLVTGASGFVGSLLVPRLLADGHELRAYARDPARVGFDIEVVKGDAVAGTGLDRALDGIEVAYYLIHSMEPSADGPFAGRELRSAERFAEEAARAGVRRVIYLGGLVPQDADPSEHLSSRLAVERVLLAATPESVAMRASIVIGARSRSFRFLVRLVERLPVLVIPAWRDRRTRPIDARDVRELLAVAATHPEAAGRSLDVAGPDVLRYGEMIDRIRDLLLLSRPSFGLPLTLTPIASRVAAAVAGEQHELIGPLMEGLTHDLLPRAGAPDAGALLGVRLHRFDAAVECALREWEAVEQLAAR